MTGFRRIRRAGIRIALVASVCVGACLPWASTASAFEVQDLGTSTLDGRVVMSPATEIVETVDASGGEQVGPGATATRAVIVHNRTEATVTFSMSIKSVVGSDAENIVEFPDGLVGAAQWVTLERDSFSLKPGQQGTLAVTIRIPDEVTPGSKSFAVTATQTGAEQATGTGVAPTFSQTGIFIVELPGDAPVKGSFTKAEIRSAQQGLDAAREGEEYPANSRWYIGPGMFGKHRLTLSTEYENTGERLLSPRGRVVVRDIFGREAGSYELKPFTVYPEGANAGDVELKGLPSLGVFTATVEIESEAAGKQTKELPRFVAIPKWFLVVVAVLLLWLLVVLVRWQLRRRREWRRFLDEDDGDGAGASADGSELDQLDGADGDEDAEPWELEDEPERV